jgi:hypothetical protein
LRRRVVRVNTKDIEEPGIVEHLREVVKELKTRPIKPGEELRFIVDVKAELENIERHYYYAKVKIEELNKKKYAQIKNPFIDFPDVLDSITWNEQRRFFEDLRDALLELHADLAIHSLQRIADFISKKAVLNVAERELATEAAEEPAQEQDLEEDIKVQDEMPPEAEQEFERILSQKISAK